MYRSDILNEVGGFNEKYMDESLDLYLRISNKYPCLYVDKCLSEYRVGEAGENLNTKVAENYQYLIEVFSGHIVDHDRYDSFLWRQYAWSKLYSIVAHNYYVVRSLNKSRRWCLKSIYTNPFQLDS